MLKMRNEHNICFRKYDYLHLENDKIHNENQMRTDLRPGFSNIVDSHFFTTSVQY